MGTGRKPIAARRGPRKAWRGAGEAGSGSRLCLFACLCLYFPPLLLGAVYFGGGWEVKFVPLVCDSSGGLGAGCGTLPCSVRRNKTLVDNPPKRGHSLGFSVKKVLEKSSGVQRLRIGIRLPLLTSFRDPIVRLGGVNNLEEARGIEIRAALIVQNSAIIRFDSNHDIRQTGREVRISRVFTTELNNHRECICLRFSSTRPMPGCSYQ